LLVARDDRLQDELRTQIDRPTASISVAQFTQQLNDKYTNWQELYPPGRQLTRFGTTITTHRDLELRAPDWDPKTRVKSKNKPKFKKQKIGNLSSIDVPVDTGMNRTDNVAAIDFLLLL
jgi:hypothetical protein